MLHTCAEKMGLSSTVHQLRSLPRYGRILIRPPLHGSPVLSELMAQFQANKIGKINLDATGNDLIDDEKQGGDVTVDLFAALDMETDAVTKRSSELENSQTLGLLTRFLAVDDWSHAHILFYRLLPLNPVEHIQICDGLFRIIEETISSAYQLVRQA